MDNVKLKQTSTFDFKQLNTTGMRTIVLFAALLESPKTIKELSHLYETNPFIRSRVSEDSMRNDINALRDAGCTISRASKLDMKYYLLDHPFNLELKPAHIKALKKIYNKFYADFSFEELFILDDFLAKLVKYTKNEDSKNEIKSISKISNLDRELLKNLVHYSNNNNQIRIRYNSKNGLKEYDLIAQKVAFRHDKLYLFCIDMRYMKNSFYKVENIVDIVNVNIKKSEEKIKHFVAKYKLLDVNEENYAFSDNEKLIKVSGNDLIIEATTDNDFIMMQNILNFGSRCVVLEPLDFRNKIIDIIKKSREVYKNEK